MRVALVVWFLAGSVASAMQPPPTSPAPTPATAGAQAPAPAAARPAAPVEAPPPSSAAVPPENYTYESGGRRDPFLSLLGAGNETRVTTKRGEGSSALTVAEISVRGVLQSRGELIAMVQGPDAKTYVVHQGDRLADGTIKNITPQGLVVVQEVNDPLSLVKQREIRKLLRSAEDAKQ
jgi:Tfp pilus assembly protein PilP